jgi:hypothetical protein
MKHADCRKAQAQAQILVISLVLLAGFVTHPSLSVKHMISHVTGNN